MQSHVSIRIADSADYASVGAAYTAWGYRGGIAPDDVVYIAERQGELIGAVRRTLEHGTTMLRGLFIAPGERRHGLGSKLLRAFVADLHGVECYCVPYSHLLTFYAQTGFGQLEEKCAPDFLRERLTAYRASGLEVIVMRRAALVSDS